MFNKDSYIHPEYFYFLLALIPLILVFVLYLWMRQRSFKKLGKDNLIRLLTPYRSFGNHWLKFIAVALAFVFMVFAVVNPKLNPPEDKDKKAETIEKDGIDLVIAFDISRSMLCQDIKPNRLERSKRFVSKLIDALGTDRVGLVVFAGSASQRMPLTPDLVEAKKRLDFITPDLISTQGTAIGDAINLSLRLFEEGAEKQYRAILLVSDGENHEGEAEAAAQLAEEEGVIVHTLGVGTEKGAPIPEYTGRKFTGYKKDKSGNVVVTKLNEAMLQQIALVTGGKYFQLISGIDEIRAITAELDKMERRTYETKDKKVEEGDFQIFIILALILLTLDFIFSERKLTWFSNLNLFREKEQTS